MPITSNVYDTAGNLVQTIEYLNLDLYLQRISSDIAFLAGLIVGTIVGLIFWNQLKGSAV